MTNERAELVGEAGEDEVADPIALYIKIAEDWEARWNFVPGEGIPEIDPSLEEKSEYLDSVEGRTHA